MATVFANPDAAVQSARPAVHTFPELIATPEARGLERSRVFEFGLGLAATLTSAKSRAEDRGRVGAVFAWHPTSLLGAEVEGSFSPRLTPESNGGPLYTSPPPVALKTRMTGSTVVRAVFTPLFGELRSGRAVHSLAMDLGLGFGGLRTVDDLRSMWAVGDPLATSTETQVHPAISWSAGPRLALGGRMGLRVRVDGLHWIETYRGVELENSNRISLGAALTVRL